MTRIENLGKFAILPIGFQKWLQPRCQALEVSMAIDSQLWQIKLTEDTRSNHARDFGSGVEVLLPQFLANSNSQYEMLIDL